MIVLQHATSFFAVSADGYDNPRAITIHRSEELPYPSPMLRGMATAPDGGMLLLLDVEKLHAFSQRTQSFQMSALAPSRSRQKRALVVEDAPVARELLCGILRSLGLVVEEATDGRQGLALARNDPPDVVLTDLEMPYMDGWEMIALFRQSPSLARVPVIVLSTVADKRRADLEALGVAAILSKRRFVEEELREWIERCTDAPN